MRRLGLPILLLLSFSTIVSGYTALSLLRQVDVTVPPFRQESTVTGLIARLLGDRAGEVVVTVSPDMRQAGGRDHVAVTTDTAGRVHVEGSSGVAVAWGLHHYLKYHCRAHVSWETSQLRLASPLPQANFNLTANDLYR